MQKKIATSWQAHLKALGNKWRRFGKFFLPLADKFFRRQAWAPTPVLPTGSDPIIILSHFRTFPLRVNLSVQWVEVWSLVLLFIVLPTQLLGPPKGQQWGRCRGKTKYLITADTQYCMRNDSCNISKYFLRVDWKILTGFLEHKMKFLWATFWYSSQNSFIVPNTLSHSQIFCHVFL